MPPAQKNGLLRALPGEPLQGARNDDGDAGERSAGRTRRPGAGMSRGGELHAGRFPALDDLDVPVHREPVQECVGDDPADAVDGGQLVAGGALDRASEPK